MLKKKKELTEKQTLLIQALFSEDAMGDFRTAMRMAGYSDNSSASEIIPPIADEIREAAKKFLATNSPKATWALINSLYDPSGSGVQNKIKAAESILNRAGVKESDDLKLNVPESGLVILPAKTVATEKDEDSGREDSEDNIS